jgi:glycerol-3-phosphate dehydrogenase
MWLYDALAGFRNVRRHRMLHSQEAREWSDGLCHDDLRALALYYDAVMDDARLVLANVVGAREAGATTLNYCAVQEGVLRDGRVCGVEVLDHTTGRHARFYAPVVVVCAGPWTDTFLGSRAGTPPLLSPTRGTHVVLERRTPHGFTLAAGRDGRIFFVLPWQGRTLIGTTDQDDATSPDDVHPREDEIEYLLDEANRFFPAEPLHRDDVISAFAGLRPLLRADGDASARSREHRVTEPRPGMLCVAGGKYTTYRAVARQVVDEVMRRLRRRGDCRTAEIPLPGGDLSWTPQEQWSESGPWRAATAAMAAAHAAPLDWTRHLVRVHGSRAEDILALARTRPDGSRALCAHQPHAVAEVLFAIREEMALRLEDWYSRRSGMAYAPCHGLEALEDIADLFATELHWSPQTREEQVRSLRRQLQTITASPAPASSH